MNEIRVIADGECEISYFGSDISHKNHSTILYYKCLTHKVNINKEIPAAESVQFAKRPLRYIPSADWLNSECNYIRRKRIE